MQIFGTWLLVLLTAWLCLLLSGCEAIRKDRTEIKKIGHDIVDEEVDNMAEDEKN